MWLIVEAEGYMGANKLIEKMVYWRNQIMARFRFIIGLCECSASAKFTQDWTSTTATRQKIGKIS